MVKVFLSLASVLALFSASLRAEDAKYFKMVHVETKKVLSIVDKSDEAAARCEIAKDDDSEIQQWKVEKTGDILKLTNRKTGKVLDVNEASADDGAEIIQYDAKDEDNDNQRWSWVGDAKEKRLKSKSSGKVLDIGEGDKVVQKSSSDKAKTQLWEAVEIKK